MQPNIFIPMSIVISYIIQIKKGTKFFREEYNGPYLSYDMV